MSIREVTRFAGIKGLRVVGTGDFTHPKWLDELKQNLALDTRSGLYRPVEDDQSPVRFMITTEVGTIHPSRDGLKKVHHVILTPSLETASQINDRLSRHGNLGIDGRPTLNMTPPALVEEIMEASSGNLIFPAHAWTPWFSVFGAFSGFDSMEDCYQDMTRHIHALETGLSSDPPMNWRLSKLDRYTLLSNSDSHSCWPWRIGREANVFELKEASYDAIIGAIRTKDPQSLKCTIETDPAYGKYHWTGHRKCNVSLSPLESRKFANICPVCRRELTKGVAQRVEELADRPVGFKPDNPIGFMRLLPLSEVIAAVVASESPSTHRVWNIYDALINGLGDEYTVLIDSPEEQIAKIAGEKVARTLVSIREDRTSVRPGYDGVYGQLILPEASSCRKHMKKRVQQLNLADFVL